MKRVTWFQPLVWSCVFSLTSSRARKGQDLGGKQSPCVLHLRGVLTASKDGTHSNTPLSFSPQTHNLCQQHFLSADHKHSQCHHQTGPICRAPFLQPSAPDETCGGQWVSACVCVLLLCQLSALLLWAAPPCHWGLHWVDFSGRVEGCPCAWISLARLSFQSQRKKQHLISRKAPVLGFFAALCSDLWCPGGLLTLWHVTYLSVP